MRMNISTCGMFFSDDEKIGLLALLLLGEMYSVSSAACCMG